MKTPCIITKAHWNEAFVTLPRNATWAQISNRSLELAEADLDKELRENFDFVDQPIVTAGGTQNRYCNIKATNLEEVLATCDRHIKNINMTHQDLLEGGDGTFADSFYIDMFRKTWTDLRNDVFDILKNK